jgi:hypothetical protein
MISFIWNVQNKQANQWKQKGDHWFLGLAKEKELEEWLNGYGGSLVDNENAQRLDYGYNCNTL